MLNIKNAPTVPVLSLKALLSTIRVPKPDSTDWLCHVYGFAYGVESGLSERGDWVKFHGDFVGHSLRPIGRKDPRVTMLRAPVAFLPDAASALLLSKGIGTNGVFGKFALRIGARFDASKVARKVEVVETLCDVSTSSPLTELLDQLDSKFFDVDEGKGPALPFDGPQGQDSEESPPVSAGDGESGNFDAGAMTEQEQGAPRERRRRAAASAG